MKCSHFNLNTKWLISGLLSWVSHPLEAEYCRALFIAASSKVTVCPFFTLMLADWKGKVLGFGAPPAKEIRDGGDRCCSSASHRWEQRRWGTDNHSEDAIWMIRLLNRGDAFRNCTITYSISYIRIRSSRWNFGESFLRSCSQITSEHTLLWE